MIMAEREGFEPPIPVKVCPLSRRIVSTAHAPLRATTVDSGLAVSCQSCAAKYAQSIVTNGFTHPDWRGRCFPADSSRPSRFGMTRRPWGGASGEWTHRQPPHGERGCRKVRFSQRHWPLTKDRCTSRRRLRPAQRNCPPATRRCSGPARGLVC